MDTPTRTRRRPRRVPLRARIRLPSAAHVALGTAVLVVAFLTACDGASGGKSVDGQRVRRVGLMHVGTDHIPPSRDALEARLKELGWVQGKNIELIWRNLEPGASTGQAQEFVRERVDVIVAFEDQSIYAAQAATAGPKDRNPVVFLHPSDPVRDGLVKSLSHPGGNLTGVFGPRDVVAKQLEIYELLVPRLRRVLTLVDPNDPATERLLLQYRDAAAHLPRPPTLDVRKASSAQDLRRIFRSLRPGEVDGAFLLSPRLRLNFSSLTIQLAERARIPVQAHRKEWVEKGALFSYGADLGPIGRAGARYVDSILRGTSPADLPVEEVPTVEFAINLKTAGRLGIKVPQDMIVRADEVYR
jgi:putative ABC transport system substrate-binding protein